MRVTAVLLLVLCLAAVFLTGCLYFTANIEVTGITCIARDALDQQDLFRSLKSAVSSGSFTGTPFNVSSFGGAEDCLFYEYTVEMRNDSFLRAEVIEIQITPMNGDILQIGDPEARDLAPRSRGSFSAVILTSRNMHNVREMTVTYYLWGLPFSARVTYSP